MTRHSIHRWFLGLLLCFPSWGQVVFSPPAPTESVFLNPPAGGVLSPTVRDDELEIYFESLGDIWRATRIRATDPFMGGVAVTPPSRSDRLEERPFLSPDGLRLYFSRRTNSRTQIREILFSSRASQAGAFGQPVSVGPDGEEPFAGLLGSLSGDELTAYLEVIRDSSPGSPLPQHTDIAFATRTSIDDRFGPWRFLKELNTENLEISPFVTRDNQTLFYSVLGPGIPGTIFVSSRSETSVRYPPGSVVQGVNQPTVSNRDPFLAFPGSRLYFVRNNKLVVASRILSATYSIGDSSALAGRFVRVPIRVATSEPDAIQFDFTLLYNPTLLEFLNVAPSPALGIARISLEMPAQGRIAVSYQAENSLPGTGDPLDVVGFHFIVNPSAPPGGISLELTRNLFVNRVALMGRPLGELLVLPGGSGALQSSWRFY